MKLLLFSNRRGNTYNLKLQVFLLQERIREMQQENSSKCSEVTSLKRELEELQQSAVSHLQKLYMN